MVEFKMKNEIRMEIPTQRNIGKRIRNLIRPLFLLGLCCLVISFQAEAQEKRLVTVLPFKIHSSEPLDHLEKGLQEMFSARLADRGLAVIPPDTVNKHPLALLPAFKMEDVTTLARDLKSDLVISGSLTQIGVKISIDMKVVDIQGLKEPFSVYIVEDDLEKLPDAADRAAKSIYNQIAGVEQIDSLEVKGNRRVESEAVISVADSKKGEALDYDQLDKDLRNIYAMGFFTDVKIETSDGAKGKIVTFVVSEKPSIGTIHFKGNKKIKDKDLLEESGIKRYAILNPSVIKQSVNRLREAYRQKGYYNVDIQERIEDLPHNEVALTYEINEGEKIYIKRIEFIGNDQFDDDDLKDLMKTSEKGFFSWISQSGRLDEKKLEFDLHNIASFYHNHGYIKAKTGEPEVTHEKDAGLIITVPIIEGPQYTVNEVTIEGDLIKPIDELMEKVGIKKERFFNREIVRKDTLTLREIYANDGYAYVDVNPYTREDDEKNLVDITYRVSKGPKVRLERINIAGNTVTRDSVIRRELHVIEGDYFSGKGMSKSTENLNRMGYFESVELQPKKGGGDDLMILDVNVKERPTGSFSVGAGYSSFDNVVGTFQIAETNLMGKGQKLSAAARLGSRTTEFIVKFTEPWLFNQRLALGVDLYKWSVEYDDYTKDSLGGSLRLNIPLGWDDYTEGLVKYTYDDADISEIGDDAALEIKDMEGRWVTSSVRLGIGRDSTDRPWNTTRGSNNLLTFEYAGGIFGGDVYFNRYEFKSTWFFPLWKDTVFMAQGRWGYVEGRSGGKLPIYQKYFLGGMNTVRGFDYEDITPRDLATGDGIGGEKMMVYNLEYRFPLLKDQGVIGLVFFDAGNVFTKDENYSFSGIKKSAGAGIRWYSPMGPIRLEYGWVIGPKEDEPSGNFDFSIGGAF
ncbi:MAG: outer membrane protein assembly factor BamA [Desulfatiglandales bacterium]